MSGMTRSMPNISSSGNMRPQSMTTISSRYSNTYMFLPISPTPPSGMMRSGWSLVGGMGVLGMGQKRVSWGVGSSAGGGRDGAACPCRARARVRHPVRASGAGRGLGGTSPFRAGRECEQRGRDRRRYRRSSRARWPESGAPRPGGTWRRRARSTAPVAGIDRTDGPVRLRDPRAGHERRPSSSGRG